MKKKRTVYLSLAAEVLNNAHINLINKAQKFGNVVSVSLRDLRKIPNN